MQIKANGAEERAAPLTGDAAAKNARARGNAAQVVDRPALAELLETFKDYPDEKTVVVSLGAIRAAIAKVTGSPATIGG